jgi:hypothetical protein
MLENIKKIVKNIVEEQDYNESEIIKKLNNYLNDVDFIDSHMKIDDDLETMELIIPFEKNLSRKERIFLCQFLRNLNGLKSANLNSQDSYFIGELLTLKFYLHKIIGNLNV